MAWAEALSAKCWEYEAMMLRERHVAIPLIANDEMIAVLALDTLQSVEARRRPSSYVGGSAGTPCSSRLRCCSGGCATTP